MVDKRYGAIIGAVGVTLGAVILFNVALNIALVAGAITGVVLYFVWDLFEAKGIAEKKLVGDQEAWSDFMESNEKRNLSRELAVVLTDNLKRRTTLIGDHWYYFIDMPTGQQAVLKLNAIADMKDRYRAFFTKREIERIEDLERIESLTQEKQINTAEIEKIKKMLGITKSPIEELIET